MNVVISGPFGAGSLSDEAVLAGLVYHLRRGKHTVTVLSADPDQTMALYEVGAVNQENPDAFLSNKEAWAEISKAHLFVIAGAGVITDAGSPPSRVWLSQLESTQTAGLQTALVGVGAIPIADRREQARVQRLLHHCAVGITARDAAAKQVIIGYGMSANRISTNGDPAIALPCPPGITPAEGRRIGIVLGPKMPSRTEFSAQPQRTAAPEIKELTQKIVAEFLTGEKTSVLLVHDNTHQIQQLAQSIAKTAPDRITTMAAESVTEVQKALAACGAVLSYTYHGLILAAGCGVPVAGFAAEIGAADLLKSIGQPDACLKELNATQAVSVINNLLDNAEQIRAVIKPKFAALRKRELQNARMMELLVPRRISREREMGEKPPREGRGGRMQSREKKSDDWDDDTLI